MFPDFNKFHLSPFFFEANREGGQGSAGDNNSNDNSDKKDNSTETFDSWLEAQPKEIKDKVQPLFAARLEKLKSTVKATRDERDDFSKQLRDAIKKLDKESEDRKGLEVLANQYEEANKRADFYEDAGSYNCQNPKAAYAIAKAENLFTKSGLPDWKKIQEAVPEFFGKKSNLPKKGGAGNGTGEEPPTSMSMSDWIREEARK